MGLFSDETLCPGPNALRRRCSARLSIHNTPRYGRRSPAVLVRSDRLEADFRAVVNFRFTEF